MKKVKITVLKRNFDEELAKEYSVPNFGLCPFHQEGQVFYADFAKPEGFCDEAWKAIQHIVFALAHGAGEEGFYSGIWVKQPKTGIACCNDGLRPVVFKLEATDIEVKL